MEHVAILSKSKKLLSKIIEGKKTIESRWYKFKKTPYNNINSDDIVYFKESGEPVTVKAKVEKVLFFEDLDSEKIKKIIEEYGEGICISISFAENLKDKKFCTLIFLKDVERIKPFNINKKGYGIMTAWITLNSIDKIISDRVQE